MLLNFRYHSFYPWHSGGNYEYLCTEDDLKMKKWVLEFKYVKINYSNVLVNFITHALS